jgi:hypothetical protein
LAKAFFAFKRRVPNLAVLDPYLLFFFCFVVEFGCNLQYIGEGEVREEDFAEATTTPFFLFLFVGLRIHKLAKML